MKKALLAAIAALAIAGSANAAPIVINGGFETGDFTGWAQFGNTGFTGVATGIESEGVYAAFFGPVGSTGGITQNIAGTVAGESYTVSFDLANSGGTPNSFDVSFGGTSLLTLVNAGGFGYTSYSFATTAPVSLAALTFTFQQDPGYFYLDNVNVVPEPLTLSLLGLGLAGVVAHRRRRAS